MEGDRDSNSEHFSHWIFFPYKDKNWESPYNNIYRSHLSHNTLPLLSIVIRNLKGPKEYNDIQLKDICWSVAKMGWKPCLLSSGLA